MPNEKVVLITGSSGFIGSTLAKRLSETYKVIGLDRDIPKENISRVDYRSLDVASEDHVISALQEIRNRYGNRICSVIHLAAYYSFSGKKNTKYQEITVDGTKTLLIELNRLFAVEQFIFSSTMLVHTPTKVGTEISESSLVTPSWPYPESKVDAENVIRAHRGTTPVVYLRISGVYDDYCHSIPIAQHIARISEKQLSSMLFPGDVEHGQAFLHIEDLVDAIVHLIEKRSELPSDLTLLLGEDKPLSYKTLQAKIGELLHDKPWPTFQIPKFVAKIGAFVLARIPLVREPFIKPWMIDYADEHYDLDISRSEKLLQWRPKKTLLESLPKMITALKNDPVKWYDDHKIEKPLFRGLEPVTPLEENSFKTAAFISIFLGIWLISNPFTLGPTSAPEFWSDLGTGILVVILALLSLAPTLRWLRWANCFPACWLMTSPLIFWTSSSAIYSNNTLLGGLILLACTYTPSKISLLSKDDGIPEGWSYNPSTWSQRLPIMSLAFIGFLLARYLAAFQLGHIPHVWDPFFGPGTEMILKSDISKAFPVSDAGLGALSYLLDMISATIGGRNRWRMMPWMVILFGLLIIPTGVVSIVLLMLQPIGVGAWCSICLLASFIMLIMVPPAIDEVAASVQFLRQSTRLGKPFWLTLWFGSEAIIVQRPVLEKPSQQMSFPWHLVVAAILGTWLLFTPWVFTIEGIASSNLYITGALVSTFAVIAFSPVARIVRLLNVLVGVWLCLSPWLLGGMSLFSQWHSVLVGLALVGLSLPRGSISQHFGTLDPWVHWTTSRLISRKGGSII